MKLNFRTCMGSLLLAGTFFVGAPAAFSQISVGILIGAPPAPHVYAVRPVCPGPEAEYAWVDGYWYPVSGHYLWHGGYWTRPPYEGARWISPRHDGVRFYEGYWDGDRGRFDHDHRWDRERDRDSDRDRDDHDRDDHERGRDRDKDHGRGRDH